MNAPTRYRSQLQAAVGALLLVLFVHAAPLRADDASARAAMENPGNPLLLITTARGQIYLEMLTTEAPQNVANFLALAEGEVEIPDRETGQLFTPRYFDGMTIHRVIPGVLVQAGSPALNVFGAPARLLGDEINANSLGLDQMPVTLPDGSFNPVLGITDREDLEEKLLLPLYRAMNISSNETVRTRQFEIDERLRNMTLKQAYENLGYTYTERFQTRPITRGVVALANSGPDTNGPEFFIAMTDADWLNGRYTVIGRVVEGMNIVDTINQDGSPNNGRGVLIYNVRRL